MAKKHLSKLSVLGLMVTLIALSGCSSSSGPSYSELVSEANEQRDALIEGEEYRIALASRVSDETRDLSESNIAKGPLRHRRPFIGVRVGDPR